MRRRLRHAVPGVALVALAAGLAGCGRGTNEPAVASAPRLNAKHLIEYYGCGACHVIGGIDGADGHVGPPLTNFASSYRMIVGKLPNTPENVARWIHDPQKYVPGSDMPVLGIGMKGSLAIAAYLDGQ